MELRINEYQVTPEITFNFEELKAEVAERVSYYKDLVYTDEQMKEAKADRAKLRKVIDAIDSQRKQVKADLLQPYTALEQKLDEIKALVQEPIMMIDNQVKAYEELQKRTKEESIRQTFENKGYGWMADVIWNPKWLNATYSMKNITEEIEARIFNYETDMKIIENLEEYSFEAAEEYKKTLDLGKTMVLVNELKEQAKRKAEYEAQKIKELSQIQESVPEEADLPIDESKAWVCFKAYVTVGQAMKLKEFFITNGIEFKKGE